jgi:O-antigen/teichoic acid export membrane protein
MISRRRYRLASYSTIASVGSKALSLLVLYLSIPLTIAYLGESRFGVWMTLASFISFLGFLDFGVGSSLINEVAYCRAKGDDKRLARLITHGLLLLTVIGIVLATFLLGLVQVANLNWLFNVSDPGQAAEIHRAAVVLVLMIGVSLPLVGLQRIFWGLQEAFVFHILSGLGSLISLVTLYYLSRAQAGIPVLLLGTFGIQLVASLPLFVILMKRRLVGSFDRDEFRLDCRDLFRHGSLFFVLSIGGAVAWDADYIIISHTVGATAVVTYAIAVRLFQLVEIPLQMASAPLWSAYADAMAQGDGRFLRKTLTRSFGLTVLAAMLGCSVILVSHDLLVGTWVGQAVTIPWALLATMAVWTIMRTGGNVFAMYLNGIRVVRPQVILVGLFCAIALPLKIFASASFQTPGVVAAGIFAYLICVIVPYLTFFRKTWTIHLAAK